MLAQDYPVTLICDVLGYPRSSYYYHAVGPDDRQVRAAITSVAAEWPTYTATGAPRRNCVGKHAEST